MYKPYECVVNKRILIISPYFPPVNASDMQRVRMSLPYFTELGWEAEVVMVNEQYADMTEDPLLLQSVPAHIKIHKIKALHKNITSKFGLGSIALRSLLFYKMAVNKLLTSKKYDLIYFSTTQFPVCILGAYWRKKFGIPYVIDMQDPWHSDYYQDKPRKLRPPKYRFAYHLNRILEPVALKRANGLIAVSDHYIADLKDRYPEIKDIPTATITFGAFQPDMQIAANHAHLFHNLLSADHTNIVYIGRGGADMHQAIIPLFKAIQHGLKNHVDGYHKLRCYFIGTSYATTGQGLATILPLARQYGLTEQVVELTDRISYYHTLITLQQAHGLFIPGSDDPAYTASKIYPYLLTRRPILAIFNPASSTIPILREYGVKHVYDCQTIDTGHVDLFLTAMISGTSMENYHTQAIEKYSARQMAINECLLFEQTLAANHK
ncbi:MAG: hypothetical protein JWR38_5282 [Mucilaginibacter sp.]|nr:hypothetical protein [Mucilaginibacter sp.]